MAAGNPIVLFPILLDGAFTAYDVATLAADKRALTGLAVAEIVVTAPQVLITGAWFTMDVRSKGYPSPESAILFTWTSALLIHGVVSVAMGPGAPAAPKGSTPASPSVSFAPTWFNDEARATSIPGVAAVGTF